MAEIPPAAGQPYKVVMPKLGLIMTEANLLEWFKSDGDRVEKGEMLFSFESDKSVVEIESPARRNRTDPGRSRHHRRGPNADRTNLSRRARNCSSVGCPCCQDRGHEQVSMVVDTPTMESQVGGLRATPKARKLARTPSR